MGPPLRPGARAGQKAGEHSVFEGQSRTGKALTWAADATPPGTPCWQAGPRPNSWQPLGPPDVRSPACSAMRLRLGLRDQGWVPSMAQGWAAMWNPVEPPPQPTGPLHGGTEEGGRAGGSEAWPAYGGDAARVRKEAKAGTYPTGTCPVQRGMFHLLPHVRVTKRNPPGHKVQAGKSGPGGASGFSRGRQRQLRSCELGGGGFPLTLTPTLTPTPSKPHGLCLQSMLPNHPLPLPLLHPQPMGGQQPKLAHGAPWMPWPCPSRRAATPRPPPVPRACPAQSSLQAFTLTVPPAPPGPCLHPKHRPTAPKASLVPLACSVLREVRRRGATGGMCGQAGLAWTPEVTQQGNPSVSSCLPSA